MISVIALLLALLFPMLSRAQKQARAVVCETNLRHWGIAFAAYQADSEGLFPETRDSKWVYLLRPYYGDSNDVLLCPMASKRTYRDYDPGDDYPYRHGDTFQAWGPLHYRRPWLYGSYAMNEWLSWAGRQACPVLWTESTRRGADIPVLTEWVNTIVLPTDEREPPEGDGFAFWQPGLTMGACINRHHDAVNGLFLDGSVRKIGLKELWTLKWSFDCDTAGAWTRAGGVRPTDWPEWMRKFRDY